MENYSTAQFQAWVRLHSPFLGHAARNLVGALTLVGEIRSGSYDSKIAVAQTFNNRARDKGRSIPDICLQFEQYSCWWPVGGRTNYAFLMALTEGTVTAIERYGYATAIKNAPLVGEMAHIVSGVIDELFPDHTFGSTHYYVEGTPEPAWAVGKTPAAHIGPHLFFNNIPW